MVALPNMKTLYAYDDLGLLRSTLSVTDDEAAAQKNCTELEPPPSTDTTVSRFNGVAWEQKPKPPASPSAYHTWDVGAWSWVDFRDLATTKADQWAAIKALRDAKKSGGFKFGLRWFHSDEPSRAQYGILLTTALEKSLPTVYVLNATWKDMSGTKAPLTVADLRGVRDAGLLLEAQLFAVAEAHRAAMEASATPSDYDFSTGWPATFKDAT